MDMLFVSSREIFNLNFWGGLEESLGYQSLAPGGRAGFVAHCTTQSLFPATWKHAAQRKNVCAAPCSAMILYPVF